MKAKEVLYTLNLDGEPIGLRSVDQNNKLADVNLDLISGVSMHTIWYNEKLDLLPQGNLFITQMEIDAGKVVKDRSNDPEFVQSVIQLLRYEQEELNFKGTNKDYCYYIEGELRETTKTGDDYFFSGYILAPSKTFAAQSVKAYYAQIGKVRNHLIDVRPEYAKRVKMVDGFTPLLSYVEKEYELATDRYIRQMNQGR